jgi:hypothetical protein
VGPIDLMVDLEKICTKYVYVTCLILNNVVDVRHLTFYQIIFHLRQFF